jgi:phosphoglycolate phosphatase-like HAD superfamily hydrolase
MAMARRETAFLFDLDGTLVDSVYQHVLAWKEALDAEGIPLSVWRIHRKIGMSGGLFTHILLRETGLDITTERVDRLRRAHAAAYQSRPAACARCRARSNCSHGSRRRKFRGPSRPADAWKRRRTTSPRSASIRRACRS